MTISDLRVLVDNLDEYIHIPGGIERLKKTVLHLAISGQLVAQDSSEGTGEDLYKQIQAEKTKLPKKQKPQAEITSDERPFDIPNSWMWVRLESIATLIGDGLHGTPAYGSGEYYFINGNNLGERDITIKSDTKTVPESEYQKYKKDLGDGTLLLSINGTIGKISYFNGEKVMLGKSAAYINFTGKTFKYYIGIVLKSVYATEYFFKNKTGTTIYNLGLKAIRDLPLPMPTYSEQQRIVEKVDEIFGLIDELEKKYKAEDAERVRFVKSSLRALSHNDSSLALENLTSIIKTKADASELRKAISGLVVNGVYTKSAEPMEIQQIIDINFGTRITKKEHEGEKYPVYGGGGESFRTNTCNREDEWVVSRFAMSKECVRYVSGEFFMLDSGFTFDIKKEYQENIDKDYVGYCLLVRHFLYKHRLQQGHL